MIYNKYENGSKTLNKLLVTDRKIWIKFRAINRQSDKNIRESRCNQYKYRFEYYNIIITIISINA